jgi:hypothetical protein
MTHIPSHAAPPKPPDTEAPTDGSLHADAARLLRFGAADAAMAQASVALDRQQRIARQQERRAQTRRHEEAMERVHQLRRAAKRERIAGVVSGVGQVVQGANALVSGASPGSPAAMGRQVLVQLADKGGQVAGNVLSQRAEQARGRAVEHELMERIHAEASEAHGVAASDARSLRDRAQAHLDAVAQARAQARMGVLRG